MNGAAFVSLLTEANCLSYKQIAEARRRPTAIFQKGKGDMKESVYKSYDELPLFLSAKNVAELLGISISSTYELMNECDFPVLQIGSRKVVPKEKFREWVEDHTSGSEAGHE